MVSSKPTISKTGKALGKGRNRGQHRRLPYPHPRLGHHRLLCTQAMFSHQTERGRHCLERRRCHLQLCLLRLLLAATFTTSTAPVALCLSLENGKKVWHKRLPSSCWASPFRAEDKIYFFIKEGGSIVMKADGSGGDPGREHPPHPRPDLWSRRATEPWSYVQGRS